MPHTHMGQNNLLQKQTTEMCYKKDVFENLSEFLGKHLCRSLFFNKVAGLQFY